MNVHTSGIDLGKTVFHVVGLDQPGNVVLKRRPSRSQLLHQLANTPACLIGMEACCGAHYLGAALIAQGHEVRLIPPQFVRPFVKSNKNDYKDAEAIAEAALSQIGDDCRVEFGTRVGELACDSEYAVHE